MITIVHGNDETSSRNFYIDFRSKLSNYQVFDGENFDYNTLIEVFEGNSLFSDEKNVFIENFFSSVKSSSNEFKKIIDYLNKAKDINITFWEEKELTRSQLSALKKGEIKLFNYPKILFIFLDSLKPNNLNSILLFQKLRETMADELIFFMVTRQFRLMLSVLEEGRDKIEEYKRLAPWQISKFRSQAKSFGSKRLVNLYKKLYLIDYKTKFGLTPLSLDKNVDIFLSEL